MEIHPMSSASVPISIIENPGEILPTMYSNEYDNMFQLNPMIQNDIFLKNETQGCMKTKKKLECSYCQKIYTSVKSFRKHLHVHEAIERTIFNKGLQTTCENRENETHGLIITQKKKLECPKCPKIYTSVKSYKKHLCVHKAIERKSMLKKKREDREKMKLVARQNEEHLNASMIMEPELFGLKTKTENEAGKIVRQEANSLLKIKKKLVCPKCPKIYTVDKSFRKHLLYHNVIEQRNKEIIKELQKKREDREKIMKLIARKSIKTTTENEASLIEEQKTNSSLEIKKKFECAKCPRICTSVLSFRKHLRAHETVERRNMGIIKARQTRREKREQSMMATQKEQHLEASMIMEPEVCGLKTKTENEGKIDGQEAIIQKKKIYTEHFQCPECPKICTSHQILENHLRAHATIERRKLGIIKNKKTRQANMDKMLELSLEERLKQFKPVKVKRAKLNKEGYDCTCGQKFKRRSRLETCLRSHNLSTNITMPQCVTCRKKFANEKVLAWHRERLHRNKFPCKFCPTNLKTEKELFKHLRIHKKVQLMEYKVISKLVEGKQKLHCFICTKSYAELSDLKCHVIEDHKEPYKCPLCKSTFNKIIDFGDHTKTTHPEIEGQAVLDVLEAFSKLVKEWKCEDCGQQFHDADKLAFHQVKEHIQTKKGGPYPQCPDCHRVFVNHSGLVSHRRIIHMTTEITEETEKPAETDIIMCVECRKICTNQVALTSHMRLHSLERKYPCKYCEFRFSTAEKMKAHSEIHTGDLKFVCFICDYQCSSENRLKQHKMSMKHLSTKENLTAKQLLGGGESSNKSEVEDKERNKEETVDDRKSDDNSDSEVACEICDEKFASENAMLVHKQTHPFIEFPNEENPTRIFFK